MGQTLQRVQNAARRNPHDDFDAHAHTSLLLQEWHSWLPGSLHALAHSKVQLLTNKAPTQTRTERAENHFLHCVQVILGGSDPGVSKHQLMPSGRCAERGAVSVTALWVWHSLTKEAHLVPS